MSVHVELRLATPHVREWHVDLLQALSARPATSVQVLLDDTGATWDDDADALFRRERRLHGLRPGRSDRVCPDRMPLTTDVPAVPGVPVVRIDLTGGPPPADGSWWLTFDGEPGEAAVVRSLLAGQFPVVRLVDGAGAPVAEGRPGSENPGVVVAALEDVLAGCVELVLAAVSGNRLRLPTEPVEGTRPANGVRRHAAISPGQQSRRTLARAGARRAYHALYRSPHWRVGWRFVDGAGVQESEELPTDGWHDLPDDGNHFYADPFPIVVDDRTFLFVEDFDHRVGRGVISVVEFDDAGPRGAPRPVLEHDVHLSYPFVLEDGGDLWLIPETSAAGTVELYRATDFPGGWVLESVLLHGVEASDVTPFQHGGRWWLSATVRRGGSFSDALHLWYADDLRGPWTPHARNPVLVDIASARPAGRLEHHQGRLLRPAQDGTSGYGAALTLTEVVELDPSTYVQRVVARLRPGTRWPGSRLHTLNRAGDLEVIDGSGRSPRLRLRSGR